MKKILIITTNFPPSTSIGTQRIIKILKFIDKNEFKPYVLTLKKKYFNKRSVFGTDPYVDEIIEKIDTIRTSKLDLNNKILQLRDWIKSNFNRKKDNTGTSFSKTIGNSQQNRKNTLIVKLSTFLEFPDRQTDWLPFAVYNGFKKIKKDKIDCIFSSSPKHSCHIIACVLKKLTGCRLTIEFRDPWARVPWIKEKREKDLIERIKHHLIKWFEMAVVKIADDVIFVTEEMKDDFAHTYPTFVNKFHTLYNGFDEDLRIELKSDHTNPMNKNRIVFSHLGALYQKRNPDTLIHALKSILQDAKHPLREKIIFQFVGSISDELYNVSKLPVKFGFENQIVFVPPVSYQESLQLMSQSDVLVVLQPGTTLQIPGKLYDYLNFGLPILAIGEHGGALHQIIENNSFGIFADYSSPAMIEKALSDIVLKYGYYQKTILKNRYRYNFRYSIKKFEKIVGHN